MTTTEIITITGIGLTFSIGVCNLIISLKSVRKTTFINSITASRIKYIQQLRESISKFCGLAHSYANKVYKLEYKDVWELHKEADNLKFLIRLYLNPEDDYWDNKIIDLIDKILLKSDKDPAEPINELVIITQYLLKLEWEGAKLESENGIISKTDKKKLYDSYVESHKQAVNKKQD